MSDFQPNLEDLALFFSDDRGGVAARWVPKTVYQTTPWGDPKPEWKNAPIYSEQLGVSGAAFVVNLSTLIGPGDVKPQAGPVARRPASVGGAGSELAKDDLVVIPFSEPNNAYVVRSATYRNSDACPAIGGPSSSDLSLMALTEGTVLANLHRPTNNTGWTCVLLNLLTLRMGALPDANKDNKSDYYRTLTSRKSR